MSWVAWKTITFVNINSRPKADATDASMDNGLNKAEHRVLMIFVAQESNYMTTGRWPQPGDKLEVLYYLEREGRMKEDWRPGTCLVSNYPRVEVEMADGTRHDLHVHYSQIRHPIRPGAQHPRDQ